MLRRTEKLVKDIGGEREPNLTLLAISALLSAVIVHALRSVCEAMG